MRSRIILSALVLAALLGTSTGSPDVSAAGPFQFAAGGGSLVDDGGNVKHFAFSGHAGPNGPSGHVVLTQISTAFGDFELQGQVVCVTVAGNQAAIGVAIDKGTGTAAGQAGIIIYAEDNGKSGPDQFNNSGYVGDPTSCAIADPGVDVGQGNVTVK